MSSIDVLGILQEFCAGDDGKYIDVLLDYINELEDGAGIIDKLNSLDGDNVIIRVLEGYASFLRLLVEVEHEDADEDEVLSTDQRRDIVGNRTSSDCDSYQNLRYRDSRGYEYDKFDTAFFSGYQKHSGKFENSIKGTDYAYGGFMSEDDD